MTVRIGVFKSLLFLHVIAIHFRSILFFFFFLGSENLHKAQFFFFFRCLMGACGIEEKSDITDKKFYDVFYFIFFFCFPVSFFFACLVNVSFHLFHSDLLISDKQSSHPTGCCSSCLNC